MKTVFYLHRNILIPYQTISRTRGSQWCCFIRPWDPNMLGHGNTNNQLKFLSTILIRVKNLQSNACLLNHKTIGHLPNCNIRAAWTSYNLDEGNSLKGFFIGKWIESNKRLRQERRGIGWMGTKCWQLTLDNNSEWKDNIFTASLNRCVIN